jgi:hypothetical protein
MPGLKLLQKFERGGFAGLDVQFFVDVFQVRAHGVYADAELGADLLVKISLGQRFEDIVPYWMYYLLAATNLATPMGQWQTVATNNFDATGNFNFTNPFPAGSPQQYFLLKLQ